MTRVSERRFKVSLTVCEVDETGCALDETRSGVQVVGAWSSDNAEIELPLRVTQAFALVNNADLSAIIEAFVAKVTT